MIHSCNGTKRKLPKGENESCEHQRACEQEVKKFEQNFDIPPGAIQDMVNKCAHIQLLPVQDALEQYLIPALTQIVTRYYEPDVYFVLIPVIQFQCPKSAEETEKLFRQKMLMNQMTVMDYAFNHVAKDMWKHLQTRFPNHSAIPAVTFNTDIKEINTPLVMGGVCIHPPQPAVQLPKQGYQEPVDRIRNTDTICLFRDDGKRYKIEKPRLDQDLVYSMYTKMKTNDQKDCNVFVCIREFRYENEGGVNDGGFIYPCKKKMVRE
jgi:hypothetical protein